MVLTWICLDTDNKKDKWRSPAGWKYRVAELRFWKRDPVGTFGRYFKSRYDMLKYCFL